jgi:hypothetical protein
MTHHFGNMVDLFGISFYGVRLAPAREFAGYSVDDVICRLLAFFFAI